MVQTTQNFVISADISLLFTYMMRRSLLNPQGYLIARTI